MQVSWSNEVCKYTDKPVLILAPLAVAGQTIEEGLKIGIEIKRLTEQPILGIGSEVYQAINMNRKAIGIELKPSYFTAATNNCKSAQEEKNQVKIFAE